MTAFREAQKPTDPAEQVLRTITEHLQRRNSNRTQRQRQSRPTKQEQRNGFVRPAHASSEKNVRPRRPFPPEQQELENRDNRVPLRSNQGGLNAQRFDENRPATVFQRHRPETASLSGPARPDQALPPVTGFRPPSTVVDPIANQQVIRFSIPESTARLLVPVRRAPAMGQYPAPLLPNQSRNPPAWNQPQARRLW